MDNYVRVGYEDRHFMDRRRSIALKCIVGLWAYMYSPMLLGSSPYETVSKHYLVKSFDHTPIAGEAKKLSKESFFEAFYSHFAHATQRMSAHESRSRVLWNLFHTQNKVNSHSEQARDHMQNKVRRAFKQSLTFSAPILSEAEHFFRNDLDLLTLTSSSQKKKDTVRYDLIARRISPAQNSYLQAAVHSNDLELLQYLEEDQIEWGIEPVFTRDVSDQPHVSKNINRYLKTTLRVRSPFDSTAPLGLRLGISDTRNIYRLQYDNSAQEPQNQINHTLNIPYRSHTIRGQIDKNFSLRSISALQVFRFNDSSIFNLHYYKNSEDIQAEIRIPTSNIQVSIRAVISLD